MSIKEIESMLLNGSTLFRNLNKFSIGSNKITENQYNKILDKYSGKLVFELTKFGRKHTFKD